MSTRAADTPAAGASTETAYPDWRRRLVRNLAGRSDSRWEPLTFLRSESDETCAARVRRAGRAEGHRRLLPAGGPGSVTVHRATTPTCVAHAADRTPDIGVPGGPGTAVAPARGARMTRHARISQALLATPRVRAVLMAPGEPHDTSHSSSHDAGGGAFGDQRTSWGTELGGSAAS